MGVSILVGHNSEEFAFFGREVFHKKNKLLGPGLVPNSHSIFMSNIRPQTVPDPVGISHDNLANRKKKDDNRILILTL